MPDEIISQIDEILLRIKAKQADLAQIKSSKVKQRGLRQVSLSDDERMILMVKTKQKYDQEINKMIEKLNRKLEAEGK
jgi:hypothetical protein